MNKEDIDPARSLGPPERKITFKYTLSEAIISTFTMSGLQLADRLGNTVVLEAKFA